MKMSHLMDRKNNRKKCHHFSAELRSTETAGRSLKQVQQTIKQENRVFQPGHQKEKFRGWMQVHYRDSMHTKKSERATFSFKHIDDIKCITDSLTKGKMLLEEKREADILTPESWGLLHEYHQVISNIEDLMKQNSKFGTNETYCWGHINKKARVKLEDAKTDEEAARKEIFCSERMGFTT